MKKYLLFAVLILCSAIIPNLALREYHIYKINSLCNGSQSSGQRMESFMRIDIANEIVFFPEMKNRTLFESIDDLSICNRPEVRKYLYSYLNSGREYIEKSISRSEIFLPIVKEIFDRNKDIPRELMYLPLLESGFDPNAVSPTKATGLWQFIAGTARCFNLQNNEWLDERRSVEKSTESAIRHLRNLYKVHGNWEMALAAYNGGSGYVQETIRRSGTDDFWTLVGTGAFRPETNEYVSRYAALLIIYQHQKKFGIKRINIDTEYTSLITINNAIDLSLLANIAGISMDTIRLYNTELKGDYTPDTGKPYKIRVPKRYADAVEKAKTRVYLSMYEESISRL